MPAEVTVRVPASAGYVHVLRTVVAGVAARTGCSVDVVADLRLAVDEAAGRLLAGFPNATALTVGLDGRDDALEMTVGAEAPAPFGDWPPPQGASELAWRILSALVDVVDPIVLASGPAIRLVVRIEAPAR